MYLLKGFAVCFDWPVLSPEATERTEAELGANELSLQLSSRAVALGPCRLIEGKHFASSVREAQVVATMRNS